MIDNIISQLNSKNNVLAMSFYPSYPVSTNDMYIPVSKGHNTRRAYYKKSSELINYQECLYEDMTNTYGDKIVAFLDYCKNNYKNLGFKMYFYIGMSDMNYKQKSKSHDIRPYDISNYIKSTEDIISSRLGIDDKYNMELYPMKYKSNEDHWRYTIIIIPIDYSFYNDDLFYNKISEICLSMNVYTCEKEVQINGDK